MKKNFLVLMILMIGFLIVYVAFALAMSATVVNLMP